jgi:hypothetical protein
VKAHLLSLLVLSACDASASTLYVDVRSDLVPGVEFTRVDVFIDPSQIRTFAAAQGQDFVRGERVAELTRERRGQVQLSVELYDPDELVAARPVIVQLEGSRAVTVLITRDCREVPCPEGQACWAGSCVDARCTERCASECTDDDECVPAAACAEGRCDEGACVFPAREDACDRSQYCDPDVGCEPAIVIDAGMPAGVDAGVPDAGVDAGPPCGPDELLCGTCVDPNIDEDHCRVCGNACIAPATCWDAACGLRELLYWINERRSVARMCGAMSMPAVPPLAWNDLVATANQRHAAEMAGFDSGAAYTDGRDGSSPSSRLTDAEYAWATHYPVVFVAGAEELLPDIVDQAFDEDAGRCRELMSATVVDFGAGAAIGASGAHYWSFQLARPR